MDETTKDIQALSGSSQEPRELGPIKFSPELNLWERQPGEPLREFTMFSFYLDLEPQERTLAKAYKAYLASMGRTSKTAESGGVIPYFHNASKQYRWRERVDAYERYISTRVQDILLQRKVDARVEMAKLGRVLGRKSAEAAALLQTMVVIERGGKRYLRSALTVREITQLARMGMHLESTALGIGGSGSGSQVTVNVNTAPPDDEAIVQKAEEILLERKKIIDAELSRPGGSSESSGQRSTDMDIEQLLRT